MAAPEDSDPNEPEDDRPDVEIEAPEDQASPKTLVVDTAGQAILTRDVVDEMRGSYIDYAMSVIVGRALPDVRDGLKPVQRRILYSMHEQKIYHNSRYRKCAKIVGEVMGSYHPHGDSAIYDALVRMAQPWSLRYQLVDGQGNFGSMDGDPPAAMRYTESRLQRISETIIGPDMEKETVDYRETYDGEGQEPEVLPAMLPNLLLNGSSGIAVGMATNIPPHNLGELVNVLFYTIDHLQLDTMTVDVNPQDYVREALKLMGGPDFPTGGTIYGVDGIISAYSTGRGRVRIRGNYDVEELRGGKKNLVFTEIPYQVNKRLMLETIAGLVKDKKIAGIVDLRDESDQRRGIRVVIELSAKANEDVVVNLLYKHTQLETTFGIHMLALDHGRPRTLSLQDVLILWLKHRDEVIVRRTQFELKKAQVRAHILEGQIKVLSRPDELFPIIRKSTNRADLESRLIETFELTEKQANNISGLPIYRLTSMEIEGIRAELEQLQIRIAELEGILADKARVFEIIRSELEELRRRYADPRRCTIELMAIDYQIEDLIPRRTLVVTMTEGSYIKSIPLSTYRSQRRGGAGLRGMGTKETDQLANMFIVDSHHWLLFFTNMGQVYRLKAYQVPSGGRTAGGRPVNNIIERLREEEEIHTIIPVDPKIESGSVVFATRKGIVKRTRLLNFRRVNINGKRAIRFAEGDELVSVKLSQPSQHGLALASAVMEQQEGPARVAWVLPNLVRTNNSAAGPFAQALAARGGDPERELVLAMLPRMYRNDTEEAAIVTAALVDTGDQQLIARVHSVICDLFQVDDAAPIIDAIRAFMAPPDEQPAAASPEEETSDEDGADEEEEDPLKGFKVTLDRLSEIEKELGGPQAADPVEAIVEALDQGEMVSPKLLEVLGGEPSVRAAASILVAPKINTKENGPQVGPLFGAGLTATQVSPYLEGLYRSDDARFVAWVKENISSENPAVVRTCINQLERVVRLATDKSRKMEEAVREVLAEIPEIDDPGTILHLLRFIPKVFSSNPEWCIGRLNAYASHELAWVRVAVRRAASLASSRPAGESLKNLEEALAEEEATAYEFAQFVEGDSGGGSLLPGLLSAGREILPDVVKEYIADLRESELSSTLEIGLARSLESLFAIDPEVAIHLTDRLASHSDPIVRLFAAQALPLWLASPFAAENIPEEPEADENEEVEPLPSATTAFGQLGADDDPAILSVLRESISVVAENDEHYVLLATKNGKAARVNLRAFRHLGRTARGVKGIKIVDDDIVVSMELVANNDEMLTMTDRGYGKRSLARDYRAVGRGAMGVRSISAKAERGDIVAIRKIHRSEELFVLSQNGMIIRVPVEQTSLQSRTASGSRVMRMKGDDRVIAFASLPREVEEEGEETEGGEASAEGEGSEGEGSEGEGSDGASSTDAEITDAEADEVPGETSEADDVSDSSGESEDADPVDDA